MRRRVPRVVDHDADEDDQVRVSVDDGVEERAEPRHAPLHPRDPSVEHVEDVREDEHQPAREEVADPVEPGAVDVDEEPGEREDVRRDDPRPDDRTNDSVQDIGRPVPDGTANRHTCAGVPNKGQWANYRIRPWARQARPFSGSGS